MIKKLLILTALGALLSGCFMAPLAFIGPATSGFTTASIVQSSVTSTASYIYKKNTGKTFVEQALITLNKKKTEAILKSVQQTYLPKNILSEQK
jgi:hypothetical protein